MNKLWWPEACTPWVAESGDMRRRAQVGATWENERNRPASRDNRNVSGGSGHLLAIETNRVVEYNL